jgi:hypothetical protein
MLDPHFLDLGTSCRWVVSFTLHLLYPWELAPCFHWLGGLAPEPVWTTWRSENSWHYRDPNSDSSVVQPVANRYTDCATASLEWRCFKSLSPNVWDKSTIRTCSILWMNWVRVAYQCNISASMGVGRKKKHPIWWFMGQQKTSRLRVIGDYRGPICDRGSFIFSVIRML